MGQAAPQLPGIGHHLSADPSHVSSAVGDYTGGNLAKALIDGQDYMKEWHGRTRGMLSREASELYYAGWRYDPVHTLAIWTRRPMGARPYGTRTMEVFR